MTTSVPALSPDRQAVLDEFRSTFGSPGAVVALRASGTHWIGVAGVADLAGARLTDTSRFRIGSISKTIIAFLVLDAVSSGELSLDDTVGELLPDVPLSGSPITVRMLLDHTSGLFNVGDEGDVIADIAKLTDPVLRSQATDLASRYAAGENVLIPDRLFVALADTHDRYFEPGTGYHYSNVNYQLAAMVLARVTGRSVAELLRSRIIEPLGLRRTTLAPDDMSLPDMHGYVAGATGAGLKDVTDDTLAFGNGGGGGVISTADELLTIMQAIVSGRLLDATLEADMKRATAQSSGSYGLGLATYHLTCGTFYGHGGAIDGTQSIALIRPDASSGVVVAVNLRKATDPDLLKFADTLICAT